jgi:hypothetical protein
MVEAHLADYVASGNYQLCPNYLLFDNEKQDIVVKKEDLGNREAEADTLKIFPG